MSNVREKYFWFVAATDDHVEIAALAAVPNKHSRQSMVADTTTGERSHFALDERIATELRTYLMMRRLPPTDDHLSYYTTHTHLPLLGQCAQMLSSCPATSVPSECAFTGAGQTYEGRPTMSAKNAEMLVVCKYAFRRGMRCSIMKCPGDVSAALFNDDD